MSIATDRLRRRIERDFPFAAAEAMDIAGAVVPWPDSNEGTERVQAAMVLYAAGDLAKLREARDLANLDWRDLLAGIGLADEGWAARLDDELGPTATPGPTATRRKRRSFFRWLR